MRQALRDRKRETETTKRRRKLKLQNGSEKPGRDFALSEVLMLK